MLIGACIPMSWPIHVDFRYGVHAAANWEDGKGDVLRAFADAANRWGIKICYYSNPRDDGYLVFLAWA